MKSVLFLCTGNYYRSRFAEIFFNWHAEQNGIAWRAFSRGLALVPSNPGMMSRHTTARLKSLGISLENYERLPIDVAHEDFEAAHHIVAVKEDEHRRLIAAKFPTWAERIEFWSVHDLDCAGPEEAIPHLEREVLALIERLCEATVLESVSGSDFMSDKNIVHQVMEKRYGPCPVGDFLRANAWAEAIDWEEVQEAVEAEHPDFQWYHPHPKDMTAAEAVVFDARHEMLRHAGHDVDR